MQIPSDKIDTQFGDYIRSKSECLQDLRVIKLVDDYKRNISQKLRALHPETLQKFQDGTSSLNISEQDLYVSIKIDGEGMFLVYDQDVPDPGEKVYICNASKHRVVVGLEAAKMCEEIFVHHSIRKAIIAGELFAAPLDGEGQPNFNGRSRVRELLHCFTHSEALDRIGFKVFDIIELDAGERVNYLDKMYTIRYEKITDLFPDSGRVAHVKTYIVNQMAIAGLYEQIVGPIGSEFDNPDGAEGLVIKTPHNFRWFKVKPVHTIDAVIIGALAGRPGSDTQENQLSVALTALRYADGTYQVLGRVGSGLDSTQQEELWQRLEFVDSQFISVARDGRAFHMVKPTIVVQIKFLDLFARNFYDQPNKRPAVSYDATEQNWKLIRPLPFVRLISPRFDTENPIREDKTADIFDVRVEQLTDFVDLAVTNSVEELSFPNAEILVRYVYENKQKVKKFLMWKSNKYEIDSNYSKYAIFFTDYSPVRKSPLDRKIRVTNSESQAGELFNEWIHKEMANSKGVTLKKGWTLYQHQDARSDNPDFQSPMIIPAPVSTKKSTGKKSTKKTAKKTKTKISTKSKRRKAPAEKTGKPRISTKNIPQILNQINKMQNYMQRFSPKKNVAIPEPLLSIESSKTDLANGNPDQFLLSLKNFDSEGWDAVFAKCTTEAQMNTITSFIKYLKKFQN
ncbi:MAG: hypothetical protein ACTSWW_06375 [Promethearchaeota archaeon]